MDYFFPLMGAGAIIVVGLLIYIVSGKKSTTDTFTGNLESGRIPSVITPIDERSNQPGDIEAEISMLIDYGNKIAAIRVAREKLGLDLKQAKELVDTMERGSPIPLQDAASPAGQAIDLDSEARKLVAAGQLIDAVKLVRDQKALDLRAAKSYVEQL